MHNVVNLVSLGCVTTLYTSETLSSTLYIKCMSADHDETKLSM